MTGSVEISEPKCFQYGNKRSLRLDLVDNDGNNDKDRFDIRYDETYNPDDESSYIKSFLAKTYNKVDNNTVFVEQQL